MEDKLSDLQKTSKKLVIDGKDLFLRYDLNALANLEEEYGSLEIAFNFDEKEAKLVTKLRKILHIGLQANHENMSLTDVGTLFTMENMSAFQEAIESAVDEGTPDKDKETNPLAKEVKTAKKTPEKSKAGQ